MDGASYPERVAILAALQGQHPVRRAVTCGLQGRG